jgi:hypothetical protein
MMGVLLMDAGFALTALGLLCLLKPLRFLGLKTRRRATVAALAGLLLIAAAIVWPAPLIHTPARTTLLDQNLPAWQFGERHEIRVHAPPAIAYEAVRKVTAGEIRLFQALTWLRSPRLPGSKSPESILNAPAEKPILDVAASGGFFFLAEEPGREIVLGTPLILPSGTSVSTPEELAALDRPGVAKAAINFRVTDEGDGWSRVTTETRVVATDTMARLRFAAYWRTIYPGSAFIRRMWLQAVRNRAERSGARSYTRPLGGPLYAQARHPAQHPSRP